MLIRDVKVTIAYGDVTAETTIRAGARGRLRKELHDTIDRLGDQLGLAQVDSDSERAEFTTEDRRLLEELSSKTSGTSIAITPVTTKES